MARPKKQTVEYFPHYVNSGKTLFILENTFGNNGYAFWFKVLELLGNAEGHYYDCSNTPSWRFLLAKTQVSEDIANNILNSLVELEAIDKELWENRIIWSDNFVQNLLPVYSNRKADLPKKPVIKSSNNSLYEFLPVENPLNGITTDKKPQSKVKESKGKESKETTGGDDFNIFKYAQERGFVFLSAVNIENLQSDIEMYSIEEVKKAIDIADENGVHKYSYVRGVLERRRAGAKEKATKEEEFEKAKQAFLEDDSI